RPKSLVYTPPHGCPSVLAITSAVSSPARSSLFFLMPRPPPRSTLFPYTTLFRSDSIVRSLRVGDKIEIRGFGSFRTRQRKPRVGRNPKTGERGEVPAKKIPFSKPSKELKDLVNTGAPPAPAQAQAPPPAPQRQRA